MYYCAAFWTDGNEINLNVHVCLFFGNKSSVNLLFWFAIKISRFGQHFILFMQLHRQLFRALCYFVMSTCRSWSNSLKSNTVRLSDRWYIYHIVSNMRVISIIKGRKKNKIVSNMSTKILFLIFYFFFKYNIPLKSYFAYMHILLKIH